VLCCETAIIFLNHSVQPSASGVGFSRALGLRQRSVTGSKEDRADTVTGQQRSIVPSNLQIQSSAGSDGAAAAVCEWRQGGRRLPNARPAEAHPPRRQCRRVGHHCAAVRHGAWKQATIVPLTLSAAPLVESERCDAPLCTVQGLQRFGLLLDANTAFMHLNPAGADAAEAVQ